MYELIQTTTADLVTATQHFFAVMAPPDPGGGQAPPGSEKFIQILQWAFWLASAVCVLGVIVAGGSMALALNRGGSGEHVSRLGWALAGCIVIGSASALVGALL